MNYLISWLISLISIYVSGSNSFNTSALLPSIFKRFPFKALWCFPPVLSVPVMEKPPRLNLGGQLVVVVPSRCFNLSIQNKVMEKSSEIKKWYLWFICWSFYNHSFDYMTLDYSILCTRFFNKMWISWGFGSKKTVEYITTGTVKYISLCFKTTLCLLINWMAQETRIENGKRVTKTIESDSKGPLGAWGNDLDVCLFIAIIDVYVMWMYFFLRFCSYLWNIDITICSYDYVVMILVNDCPMLIRFVYG